jgi:hypothetical protein
MLFPIIVFPSGMMIAAKPESNKGKTHNQQRSGIQDRSKRGILARMAAKPHCVNSPQILIIPSSFNP